MRLVPLIAVALLIPVAAAAQTARPGLSPMEQHRFQADQHDRAMAQLRLQAQQREATTRRIEAETRLRRLELEQARRDPALTPTETLDEARARREAATARREAQQARTNQIDAWLDRRPN